MRGEFGRAPTIRQDTGSMQIVRVSAETLTGKTS
jgi:hypothetical protein